MDGRHHGIGIAVAALSLIAPATGSAATQTLGSVTPDAVVPSDCAAGDTWVERSAAPSTPYSASGPGVITSWSVRGGASSSQVKLKLLQPATAGDTDQFTARAEAGPETIGAATTSTFPVRIPVKAGYTLGLTTVSGTAACRYPTGSTDDSTRRTLGEVPVGNTYGFDAPNYQERLNVSAVLEDDADGDGFGDESQDGCPADASTQGPCPPSINDPAGRLYVALGDSWSQGVGASSEATDWVHLFFNHLQSSIAANVLSNRSIGGQSTQQLIDGPLPIALADIDAASDTVAVTLQIGGNDGIKGCRDDCFKNNHATIMAALRGALDNDPGDEVFITGGYGNPASGRGDATESSLELGLLGQNLVLSCGDREPDTGLLDAVNQNAGLYGALFANPYPGFKQGGQALMSGDGVHPNDAGHAVVEAAFEAAVPGCGEDETPPGQTLSSKAKQHADHVSITDAVDEAATVVVEGKVPLPGRDAKFKPATATLDAPGSVRLSPVLRGRSLRKVEAALEERKLEAKLTVTATDAAGNVGVEKSTVKLKD